MTVTTTAGPASATGATAGEYALTLLASFWLTVGLFLDGYAHEHLLDGDESFLTPWHLVFYSGFAAAVVVLWRIADRRRRPEQPLVDALPTGYRGAATGLALFAVGGVGDAAWHSRFGVETGIHALLSPTHLVLFAGLVLIMTAPYRSERPASSVDTARSSWRTAWPSVASVVLTTALVGFFLNFVWGLGTGALARVPYNPVTEAGEDQLIAAIGSTIVTTLVLFGAALLLVRKGHVPLGACTLLFGFVALAVAAAFDEDPAGVLAAVVAGAALDGLLRTPLSLRTVFGLAAVSLWVTYYLLVALDGPIAWHAEVWTGAVVLNGLTALALVTTTTVFDYDSGDASCSHS